MRSLHRVTIGRTREVRGPDAIERAFVGVIIAAAMAIAVWFGMQLVGMVQTLDAVSLAAGPKLDMTIYRAVHGRWPSADNARTTAVNGHGLFSRNVTVGENGVITVELTLRTAWPLGITRAATDAEAVHGFLSFRPVLLGSRDAPTITYLCGYAQPVVTPAAALATNNKTTLDPKYLPPFCR